MKRLSKKIKNTISQLPNKDKAEVIEKFLASSDDELLTELLLILIKNNIEAYDYLEYQHTEAYDLYFEAKDQIISLFKQSVPPDQNSQTFYAAQLTRSLKAISAFVKKTHSQRLEISLRAEIIVHVAENLLPTMQNDRLIFASRIGAVTAKTIRMIRTNRPELQWPQYARQLDPCLQAFKSQLGHIKTIESLPESVIPDQDGNGTDESGFYEDFE